MEFPIRINKAFLICIALAGTLVQAQGPTLPCGKFLDVSWLKKAIISKTLDLIAIKKGLPKYIKSLKELQRSGKYLEYSNFGEMGLAELGISVRYNQKMFESIKTNRPMIVVANHHLGIADGLALQYLVSRSRPEKPALLFLARWIEKLLPKAVFGDEHGWGTAIPVEINLPKKSDPDYEAKMAEVKSFNSSWSRTSLRVLKSGGSLIIFPAGHVASINEGAGAYPGSVFDAANSWHDGFLNLARLAKADIVFAHVDSVNSEAFYRKRKRFGGGDKERVIWFFSETVAKKNKAIDVYLSEPMSLETIYNTFSQKYGYSREALESDSHLTAELFRQFTYGVSETTGQQLDTLASPLKK